jgi:glycosyltransferase involved in cell wall biosynthesis
MMLGTFGVRPKGTLRARALGMAEALRAYGWRFELATTPWDCPKDAGKRVVIDGVPVWNTRSVRPAYWPLAVRELVATTRRAHPELIHLFKPKGFGDLAGRVLRRNIPVVVDMDDWEGEGGWNAQASYSSLQRRVFDWQERTWPRQAAAVTVASQALRRRAIDLGASPDHVFFVPNGLTRCRFDELARDRSVPTDVIRLPFPAGTAAVLLYTRFVEFDPALPVRLLGALRADGRDVRLVIAGASATGVPERVIQTLAEQERLTDAITMIGWIDPATLPALAARCQVALHPFDDTLVNRAKSSVKLLELMAAGMPVVTTRVGENATFVDDGRTGVLCPPDQPARLASEIRELLDNADRAKRMGAAARRRVRDCFLWEQLATHVDEAYRLASGTSQR